MVNHNPNTEPELENIKLLTSRDFSDVLQDTLSEVLRARIDALNLTYEILNPKERDHCLLTILKTLQSDHIIKSGTHRRDNWEKGWAENLISIGASDSFDALIPNYFGKYDYVRWQQQFVRARTKGFDYQVLNILVEWMLEKYMTSVDNIYEFGCGPGYHLARARAINPNARLVGLDWATSSQAIISKVVEKGLLSNIEGYNFDFFKPDHNLHLPNNTGIYTVAALEQVGPNIEPFIQFLLTKQPSICVHIEPIDELLDENHFVDSLSIFYFRKRNYLQGFLPRLHQLENEGKIVIHNQQRTYTGSMYIEGHSLIAWSPL